MTLPEPYQQPYAPAGQPLPGWPTEAPLAGPVELYGERQPVVWVPDAYGRLVPMPKDLAPAPVQATPPRDLSPLPLLDPVAQRFIGAGIGGGALSAGVGWGIGQVVNAVAGLGSGALMWVALMVVAAKLPAARAVRGGDTYNITKTTINENRWWGRSTTHN